MIINGKVKSITEQHPYTVTMNNGDTFTSHFKFTKGATIRLNLAGDVFDFPWPSGFCHSEPNGQHDFQLSPEQVKAAKDPAAKFFQHNLPLQCRHAVRYGKQTWERVESFYTYHYTAEFNPKTLVLTTNYAVSFWAVKINEKKSCNRKSVELVSSHDEYQISYRPNAGRPSFG